MPHNGHHWQYFFYEKLHQVYFSVSFRAFALSLLGIFIPLYLFHELQFTLEQTLGFYIFYSVVLALSTPLAAKFSARFGMKHAVLLSIPLYLFFLLFLLLLPLVRVSLLFPAAFLGVSIAFYWMGMHLVIFKNSTQKHRGEVIGKQKALSVLGAVAGPLLGGLIISAFGFKVLFLTAAGILLLSAGFLFLSKDAHQPYHFSFRSLFTDWKSSLFFASQGSRVVAEGVVWPLFIFLLLGDYFSLGFLGTFLAAISATLLWIVGKGSDHASKRVLVRWIAPLDSAAWFLRSLVNTFPQILGVTFLSALAEGLREAPLSALEYDKARGNITAYFVHREIFVCLGRIFLLTLVLLTKSLAGGLFFQGIATMAALLF